MDASVYIYPKKQIPTHLNQNGSGNEKGCWTWKNSAFYCSKNFQNSFLFELTELH
jgi:hypothetical protein